MTRFYSIGHSNRTFEEFAAILRSAGIGLVADVRKLPGSRSNPVYDCDVLSARLAERQIGYRHMPALGGRRGRHPEVPEDLNGAWRNRSFHNYADYALSESFADGLAELVRLGEARPVAMMCAEAVWWRCHRRIITDHLINAGHEVVHLMGGGREAPAKLSETARPAPAGQLTYPAGAWT